MREMLQMKEFFVFFYWVMPSLTSLAGKKNKKQKVNQDIFAPDTSFKNIIQKEFLQIQKKINIPIEKWSMNRNRHFAKEVWG